MRPQQKVIRIKECKQKTKQTNEEDNTMTEKMHMLDSELENVTGGAASEEKYYTVQEGDSLSAIASRYDTSVVKLILLNPQIKNPHLIYPGDVIRLSL